MIIDEVSYSLKPNNYDLIESLKKQIVIGHTFNNNMKHVVGWLHRHNGSYKKTAAFTINVDGLIFKHFEPKHQSRYFDNIELDNRSIVILLENDGWLTKDVDKNEFITWTGDIYKQPNIVVEKKWRGYSYWSPYNEKQVESTIKLVKVLCEEFFIPMVSIGHNTKIDSINDYIGIIYKSNLEKKATDLNPTWCFDEFKNKIELNK